MKYYRFMSKVEFDQLLRGETVLNKNEHRGCRTRSKGFCFLGEDSVAISLEEQEPLYGMSTDLWGYAHNLYEAAHELVGGTCGSEEMFVEFEGDGLKLSNGTYANMASDNWDDHVVVNEYCTYKYSAKTLVPLRAWERIELCEYEEVKFSVAELSYWEEKYGE